MEFGVIFCKDKLGNRKALHKTEVPFLILHFEELFIYSNQTSVEFTKEYLFDYYHYTGTILDKLRQALSQYHTDNRLANEQQIKNLENDYDAILDTVKKMQKVIDYPLRKNEVFEFYLVKEKGGK